VVVLQRSVYVFRSGTLARRGNTLYFEGEAGGRYLPVETIRDIYAFGELTLNKRVLEFLAEKEIILHLFNHFGYYVGSYYPREHYNSGHLTLMQAAAYLDASRRLRLAQAFVRGALANILRVLRYYQHRAQDVTATADTVTAQLGLVEETADVERLMAVEGHAREAYYQAWDAILGQEDFRFETRSRRPPANRLNALISFGNSYVYTAVLSEIYKTHLDPRIGYLHTTNFRRFSLNLDVAEIFKPIVVDRVIFSLLGRRQITAKDFVFAEQGVLLDAEARRTLVEELERRMQTQLEHRQLHRRVTYRRIVRLELYKLEKDLLGETPYEPYVSNW
jgi:CRISPR-associated protein Cas1